MKWKVLFLIVLVISPMLLLPASAASGVVYPELHSTSMFGFAPAQLIITFPHTTKVDSNVTSLSGGDFTYQLNSTAQVMPNSVITYSLSASDIYSVSLLIIYPVPTSGNITWGLVTPAGTSPLNHATFSDATQVALSISVTLLQQPQYPSADQIANATVGILLGAEQKNSLQQQTFIHQQLAMMQFQMDVAFAILGVVVVVMLVVFVVIFKRFRS
ncbi:MAG: hypothetical protein JRN67_11930 [Nitrososphaerota archaeon]|nr:hypothetical protein [Nitrososphaerota archaeon]